MPAALFLSPHLDDVAFSCGGTLRALAAGGWQTTLCTIFTRSIAKPNGFALACQLDKGLDAEIDYMALRRTEDDVAAAVLGASDVERLDLAEAPHRGYESAAALFGPFVAIDEVAPEVETLLEARLGGYELIFAPQALGNHVDHRRVRDAVLRAAKTHGSGERIVWYRDAPYVLRDPDARPAAAIAFSYPHAVAFALDDAALAAKLDACAAYSTQIGFQFGGEASMRESLCAFARAEGSRSGCDGPAEAFSGDRPSLIPAFSSILTTAVHRQSVSEKP